MKNNKTILKQEREKIFSLFIRKHKLKFCEIEKEVGIRSNNLTYHIQKMVDEDILEKNGEYYLLTREAEKIIPFFAHITGKEQGCLPVVVIAIIKDNKICLLKREKRPYKDYWGMIGGKLKHSETVEETAVREAEEETGLKCVFEKVNAVLHERLIEDKVIKNSLVIFFCNVSSESFNISRSEEGEVKWFDLDNLPEDIIPSDKLMIDELLNKSLCFKEVVMEEKDHKLVRMDVW